MSKIKSNTGLSLKKKLLLHFKILIGAFVAAIIFIWITRGEFWIKEMPWVVPLVFVQIEFYMWLGNRIFKFKRKKSAGNYRKMMITRLLLFLGLVMIIAFGIYMIMAIVTTMILGFENVDFAKVFFGIELKLFFISVTVGLLFGAGAFFYGEWLNALKREKKLKEEKLVFQYQTLKSQVNPHFLFNSLNTLSSLIYKSPERSDDFIQKLSSIYRYILENKDVETVPLKKELDFVRDYFYLQQTRDEDKIELDIEIDQKDAYRILPISLQLLLENAVKHNAATRERPLTIKIQADDGWVTVSNNLQRKSQIEQSAGIGLNNLSERIKLTLGKDIEVLETQNTYTVKVPLIIADHESADH